MKVNVAWLRDFVELTESIDELKETLTMMGLVVESVSESDDVVIEIEVTSNRPDCLSHLGVARELAARFGRPLQRPQRSEKSRGEDSIAFGIEIRDPEACPRYAGIVLEGISVGPSPPWMQRRLESCGMRPLNNIVDITNYVLLEMGHPLHAFDFKRLEGGEIIVDRAREGESIVTIDGVRQTLSADDLCIRDASNPVAIAGVMGGLDSEIQQDTEIVLLECAYFDPLTIRRTSKRLGLSTEASYRFERGADWDDLFSALSRTAELIEEHAGGKIASMVRDVYPKELEATEVELSRTRAEALIGVNLEGKFIESTLKRLDFHVQERKPGHWLVTHPSYRTDIELEADLIEELARFHGYENIPTTFPPSASVGVPSPRHRFDEHARGILQGFGYYEGISLSFASDLQHRDFPPREGDRVTIRNPLTEETQHLRTSLSPGLVSAVRQNFNFGQKSVRIFEIGKVYRVLSDGERHEHWSLAAVASGSEQNWHFNDDYDFFHMKGMVAAFLRGMRVQDYRIEPTDSVPWLSRNDASRIVAQGSEVGSLGSLSPQLRERFKLRQPVFLTEIDFEALSSYCFAPVRFRALSKLPGAERDLSIVVSRETTYGEILQRIRQLEINELVSVDLVDVYEGEGVPPGSYSLTLKLKFQDDARMLTVDRVQSFSDNVLTALVDSCGARLR